MLMIARSLSSKTQRLGSFVDFVYPVLYRLEDRIIIPADAMLPVKEAEEDPVSGVPWAEEADCCRCPAKDRPKFRSTGAEVAE